MTPRQCDRSEIRAVHEACGVPFERTGTPQEIRTDMRQENRPEKALVRCALEN